MRRSVRTGGFTYVGLLLAVAIMAAGLAAIGEVASTVAKRDREAELLFVGDQFARAIADYAAASPGAQQYPPSLEDLLADKRYPTVRRHLRRIYADPMTGRPDWTLVRGPQGGIVGLHSKSMDRPLKIAGFPKGYEAFNGATSYAAWEFVPAATDARLSLKPGAPGTPGAPKAPGVPGTPGALGAPGLPATPGSPNQPSPFAPRPGTTMSR